MNSDIPKGCHDSRIRVNEFLNPEGVIWLFLVEEPRRGTLSFVEAAALGEEG